jgi:hypothetical protein
MSDSPPPAADPFREAAERIVRLAECADIVREAIPFKLLGV